MSVANKKMRELTESLSPVRNRFKSPDQSPEQTEEVDEAEEISYNSDVEKDIENTNDEFGIEIAEGTGTNENTRDELNMDGFEDKETNITDETKETKFSATAEKEIENLVKKIDYEKSQRQKLQFKIDEVKEKAA